jgi:hypothetical protein
MAPRRRDERFVVDTGPRNHWSSTMKRFLMHTLAGTAIATLSLSAGATTIQATLNSMTPQSGVTVTEPSTTTPTSAGRFNFTRTGGDHPVTPLPDAPVSRFWAFCVELGQSLDLGENLTYEVRPLADGANSVGGIGNARADDILELLGAVYPDFTQVLTNNRYAALQISIWEITREDRATHGYDVYTGDVKFSGSSATILNLANSFLSQVDDVGPRAAGIRALVNRTRQDMLVQFPVPEPGSLALSLLGLGAVFGTRRHAARTR